MIAAARQRARRAFERLSLTEAQAVAARRLLRDDRLQLEAAQGRLAECRRDLREALAAPGPDSAAVLELTLEERLLEEKERAASVRLERSLAALLRPEQVTRLRTLAPAAVGDMLGADLRLSRYPNDTLWAFVCARRASSVARKQCACGIAVSVRWSTSSTRRDP